MKLLFATGNIKKYELMKERLKEFNEIEVIMPKQINVNINVEENGKTAEENAKIKAEAFYNKTKIPTIAEDSGLYIEKFSEEEQPGLFVKRVNGKENLTEEEILNYYLEKLNKYGGESLANYRTGVALVNSNGETHSISIDEEKFLMLTKKSLSPAVPGATLDTISYDLVSKKYFNELNTDEKSRRYEKINNSIKKIIKDFLL